MSAGDENKKLSKWKSNSSIRRDLSLICGVLFAVKGRWNILGKNRWYTMLCGREGNKGCLLRRHFDMCDLCESYIDFHRMNTWFHRRICIGFHFCLRRIDACMVPSHRTVCWALRALASTSSSYPSLTST